MGEKTRLCIENIAAILTEAGSGLEKVVKVFSTHYLSRSRFPSSLPSVIGRERRKSEAKCSFRGRGIGPGIFDNDG